MPERSDIDWTHPPTATVGLPSEATIFSQPVRVGLIGCRSNLVNWYLPALLANKRCCDAIVLAHTNRTRLNELMTSFSISDSAVDYKHLDGSVDCVIIDLPITQSAEAVGWFLERGFHVLCEKPFSFHSDEAEQLAELARDNDGSLVRTGMMPRHIDDAVRQTIVQGTLGDLETITCVAASKDSRPPEQLADCFEGVWAEPGISILARVCHSLDATPKVVRSLSDSHGGAGATANLRYVDDLVQAIRLCLDRDDAGERTYNVGGANRLTWNEYFEAFNDALELPPLRKTSASKSPFRERFMRPPDLTSIRAFGRFAIHLMSILPKDGITNRVINRIQNKLNLKSRNSELKDLLRRRAYICDDKIGQTLGYRSTTDIGLGLDMTVAWLRLHGLVGSAGDEVDFMEEVASIEDTETESMLS